jgi:hypothetical protein
VISLEAKMFAFNDTWRSTRHTLLLAAWVGLQVIPEVRAQEIAPGLRAVPSALLSIDQHRSTVVDRIIADWGEALTKSNAGITVEQLRVTLNSMRSDYLLAASVAGSLDGLRSVVASSFDGSAPKSEKTGTKSLGDTADDVVYTPVTPCRLVDTRMTYAAVYQGGGAFGVGEIRNYAAAGGNGVCLTQLPSGLNPSALQLQVFGIPNNGVSGDIEVLPQGGTFGSTATLVFVNNVLISSASTTARINLANNQIGVQVRIGSAHVAIDVVGYFAAPVATALQCAQVASSSTAIAVSSDTLVALPACAAGYTRTGVNCSGPANTPSGYLVETNAGGCLFRNLSSVAAYSAIATSICCRIPGR